MRVFINIWRFYYEGFRGLPKWAKTLWTIIIIKLFVMFFIFKLFFFKSYLNRFDNEQEKANYVIQELTNINE
ncbi:MAG: hypothetical protein Kow0068_21840 [Marinilabiliales bacterium]